jgi:hypothetical protein
MYWFRSRIGLGARLALLALAVQIVLSAGHIHFYGLGLASANAASAAMAQDAGATLASKPAPIHKSDGSVGTDCAICALIQLSAISAPAAAPALPPPVDLALIGLHFPVAWASAAAPHFLFQARAPPSV